MTARDDIPAGVQRMDELWLESPERREWIKAVGQGQGMEAEERPLLAFLHRIAEPLGDEARLQMLGQLLSLYSRHGNADKTVEVFHQIQALPYEIRGGWEYGNAQNLLRVGRPDLAEQQVDFGMENLDSEETPAGRYFVAHRLLVLRLTLLTKRAAEADRVTATLEELAALVTSDFKGSEWLIPTARSLIEAGYRGWQLQAILEAAWAFLARQRRFHGLGDPSHLQEIEDLWAQAQETTEGSAPEPR